VTIGAAEADAVLTLERQRLAELRRTTEHRRVRAELLRNTPRVHDKVAALVRAGLALPPGSAPGGCDGRGRWCRQPPCRNQSQHPDRAGPLGRRQAAAGQRSAPLTGGSPSVRRLRPTEDGASVTAIQDGVLQRYQQTL